MEEKLYSVAEAAKILNKAPETVRMLLRSHGIGYKFGRDWIIYEQDIEKLKAIPSPGRPQGAKDKVQRVVTKPRSKRTQ